MFLEKYWNYIQFYCLDRCLNRHPLETDLQGTVVDDPRSALEMNNFAVMALIEAEQSELPELQTVLVEMAVSALEAGVALDDHPLCRIHLAIAHSLLGDIEIAAEEAIAHFTVLCLAIHTTPQRFPLGLVYFPPTWRNLAIARSEQIQFVLEAPDGNHQALFLCAELLYQIQQVFYNIGGLRFLQLAVQIAPQSPFLNLKLGLATVLRRPEGIFYLHQAGRLAPESSPILQALYLAYRDPQHPDWGNVWLEQARRYAYHHPASLQWQWTTLPLECPFTYLPFEDFLLAVEPEIRDIVTLVLLAEGDWFEAEMAFWRTQIQPGMTIIDVGANIGVYAFSAARRTGATGRVLAVEPSLSCVECLRAATQINGFSWVTVHPGAASDRNGTLSMKMFNLSVFNQVATEETPETDVTEAVPCFTLDSLIEQEQLQRVDWLKLDVEGHELQVLEGCDRILSQWQPKILYENSSKDDTDTTKGNWVVANFLIDRGYRLFRYHPYWRQLIPIDSPEALAKTLNIIALPGELGEA